MSIHGNYLLHFLYVVVYYIFNGKYGVIGGTICLDMHKANIYFKFSAVKWADHRDTFDTNHGFGRRVMVMVDPLWITKTFHKCSVALQI